MKGYLLRTLQDALLIWIVLAVGITMTAILYAILNVIQVPESTSLLVSFVTLVGLIILSLFPVKKSILSRLLSVAKHTLTALDLHLLLRAGIKREKHTKEFEALASTPDANSDLTIEKQAVHDPKSSTENLTQAHYPQIRQGAFLIITTYLAFLFMAFLLGLLYYITMNLIFIVPTTIGIISFIGYIWYRIIQYIFPELKNPMEPEFPMEPEKKQATPLFTDTAKDKDGTINSVK
jgi:hypothetical protein